MDPLSPILRLRRVRREFSTAGEKLAVLRGIDLELAPGDRVVLFGPSGCGKTTLLHLMALLDRPDAGRVDMDGEDTAAWTEERRCARRAANIGMIFQHFHLLPHHTARHNLLLPARYAPAEHPGQRADELLERVGLSSLASRPARLLSGGEKQRLCIARALFHRPALLLADEPTGNLDRGNARAIRALFEELAGPRHAVVIATHDPDWRSFAHKTLAFTNHGTLESHTS